MPNQKNHALRLLVPLVLALAGIGIAAAVFINSKPPASPSQTPPAQTQDSPQAQGDRPPDQGDSGQPIAQATRGTPSPDPTPTPTPTPTEAAAAPTADGTEPAHVVHGETTGDPQPVQPATGSGLRVAPSNEDPRAWAGIGAPYALDPSGVPIENLLERSSPYELRVEFSRYGAGIERMLLAHHHTTWRRTQSQGIQQTRAWTSRRLNPDGSTIEREYAASPMGAARAWITLDGVRRDVLLWFGPSRENIWRQTDSGEGHAVFEALVVEADGAPVLRVLRRYELTPGSYVVTLSHTFENLTGRPIEVQLQQFGPIDPVPDSLGGANSGYGGDKRRVRFGYLASQRSDPGQQFVVADNALRARASVVSSVLDATQGQTAPDLWPTPTSQSESRTLVWAGMTNRYFGVAVHTLIDTSVAAPAKALDAVARIEPLVERVSAAPDDTVLAMRLTGPVLRLEPGGSSESAIGLFAGPLSRPVIDRDPRARAAGLGGLVVYNFGGWCAPCTFSWLTGPLIALLRFIHDFMTGDWSLAIVVLVFIVRGLLHPVQKWSQIRTQRFGKQMQSMAPKQKKLQEKYKDDRAKLQQEMAKLWREEGITPASFVGCIPPFLQTPIWIALSAMIYFAVELRHAPAFYGAFQAIAPSWSFLADLSEQDALIDFGGSYGVLFLSFSSLNLLPFILALVFYIHSKSITPPTSATMTPEQKQAQAITKWLMVVMFPVIMYGAPAGFTLYFIANSTIAIFQTNWIKAHITKHDLDNPEKAKAVAASRRKAVSSSDTFMARLARRVEEAQKARQQGQPGPGKALQRRPDRGKEPPPRRFKDR